MKTLRRTRKGVYAPVVRVVGKKRVGKPKGVKLPTRKLKFSKDGREETVIAVSQEKGSSAGRDVEEADPIVSADDSGEADNHVEEESDDSASDLEIPKQVSRKGRKQSKPNRLAPVHLRRKLNRRLFDDEGNPMEFTEVGLKVGSVDDNFDVEFADPEEGERPTENETRNRSSRRSGGTSTRKAKISNCSLIEAEASGGRDDEDDDDESDAAVGSRADESDGFIDDGSGYEDDENNGDGRAGENLKSIGGDGMEGNQQADGHQQLFNGAGMESCQNSIAGFLDDDLSHYETLSNRIVQNGGHAQNCSDSGERNGLRWQGLEFEIAQVNIDEARGRVQSELVERPVRRTAVPGGRRTRIRKPTRLLQYVHMDIEVIRRCWAVDLAKLKKRRPDFFQCRLAKMQDLHRISQGKAAYESLPINEFNNSDIQFVYKMEYKRKVDRNRNKKVFKQLLTVAGQYMLMAIMLGKCKIVELCEPGKTFNAFRDLDLAQLFFDYYAARSEGSTVMTKGIHMKTMCKGALNWFGDRDLDAKCQVQRVQVKSNNEFNTFKQESRRNQARKRNIEDRMLQGKYMHSADFAACIRQVKDQLNGIMNRYKANVRSGGENVASKKIRSNIQLLDKWCVNLLLLVLFSAGGQRPQVYTQLQVPSEDEFANMEESVARNKYFELRTLREKTVRSLAMPNVVVPAQVFDYLRFHLKVVRPLVVSNVLKRQNQLEQEAEVGDNSLVPDDELAVSWEEQPIFFHTKTGRGLESVHITRSLKRYFTDYQPHLEGVTAMTLRSSFGTMMMKMYRAKEAFADKNEDEFLSILSKSMNTSVEQLQTTYIGTDSSDFEDAAKELARVIQGLSLEDDEDHVGLVELQVGDRGRENMQFVGNELF